MVIRWVSIGNRYTGLFFFFFAFNVNRFRNRKEENTFRDAKYLK